ncbi:hypothetical protein [Streptomyces acidiscabies]|uniref:hypothetical protein n=1 Tax=Streptomyces acidiscabies TaxID=42234 RepID=UPI00076EBD4F|nr:hypothetical protein [Streptomyces acidiscabies]GAQ51471.1 hypothetical protein a10_01251 [Streptomyces acidiscabies]
MIALTRMTPPPESGLSHWSPRTLADHLKRREGIRVSFHYVARIWREGNLKPHRSGTFKLSKAPVFAEEVADVVGLYLDPPGGAVVLSVDEKMRVQALDRTRPVLPVAFAVTEKRTHDYVRHGTTNLFAAHFLAFLHRGAGDVRPECRGPAQVLRVGRDHAGPGSSIVVTSSLIGRAIFTGRELMRHRLSQLPGFGARVIRTRLKPGWPPNVLGSLTNGRAAMHRFVVSVTSRGKGTGVSSTGNTPWRVVLGGGG